MDKASKPRQEKEAKTMGEERLNKAVGLFKARLKNQDLNKKDFAKFPKELRNSINIKICLI